MSHDEIQRTMQFLLSQQAKFAVDFDRLSERFEGLVGKTDRIADAMIGLTAIVGRLVTSQEATDRRVDSLDARVDSLRAIVEQHLRRDHGYPKA